MKYFIKVVLVFIASFSLNSSEEFKTEFITPLKHLLSLIQEPVRINVFVCWSYEDRLKFVKPFLPGIQKEPKWGTPFVILNDTKMSEFLERIRNENQNLIMFHLCCNKTALNAFTNKRYLFTTKLRWVILIDPTCNVLTINTSDPTEDKFILEMFKDLPILVDSEMYFIMKIDFQEYSIKQVYRKSPSSDLIIENVGNLNGNIFHKSRTSDLLLIQRRRNFRKTNLRSTLVVTNPDSLNHFDDYKEQHIDTISKVNYQLTNHLIEYVNGKVDYKYADSWGYFNNQTGKWTGMIGDLVDDRSDIGGSALFFTQDRIKYIEYIAMPTPTRSKFVFRSPKLSFTDNVFLLPFDMLVWYSILGLIVATSISLLIATIMEWKHLHKNSKDITNATILHPSLLDITLLVIGAVCQQGTSVVPKSITSRIIMMLIFTILMFLYTSYSANIVALLQSPSNKIQNLEDLLNSRLKLGAHDTVFNRYYFSHSDEPIRKKIYELKILNKDGTENFMPLEDGVTKLREGLFAFHMETGVGYKIVAETFLEDEKCGLQEIQYLQVIDPWYAIQKNSSYKEFFKTGMMRIHEHGLQERENAKFYTKKPKCAGRSGAKFITASIIDIRPALFLLLWGFILSTVICLIERIIKNYVNLLKNHFKTKINNN